jgi:hypothetical protein
MATAAVSARAPIQRFDWQNTQTYPKPVTQALLITTLLIVLGIGFAALVHRWAQEAQAAWQQTEQQLQSTRRTVEAQKQDIAYVEKTLPRLSDLQNKGILNAPPSASQRSEKRLDWIERIDAFGARWPGLFVKYTIDSAKPLADAPKAGGAAAPVSANVQLMQNEMKLALQALHEEDLFRLLADLQAAQLGPLIVSQCAALRANTPMAVDVKEKSKIAPEVKIDCTVKWLSLALTKPKEAANLMPAAASVTATPRLSAVSAQLEASPQLGQLFFNNAQRVELDRLRFKGEPIPLPPPTLATFDGVTSRRAGRTTVWINGQPYAEHQLPAGIVLQRAANGRITGISPSTGASATVGGAIVIPATTAPAADAKPPKSRP